MQCTPIHPYAYVGLSGNIVSVPRLSHPYCNAYVGNVGQRPDFAVNNTVVLNKQKFVYNKANNKVGAEEISFFVMNWWFRIAGSLKPDFVLNAPPEAYTYLDILVNDMETSVGDVFNLPSYSDGSFDLPVEAIAEGFNYYYIKLTFRPRDPTSLDTPFTVSFEPYNQNGYWHPDINFLTKNIATTQRISVPGQFDPIWTPSYLDILNPDIPPYIKYRMAPYHTLRDRLPQMICYAGFNEVIDNPDLMIVNNVRGFIEIVDDNKIPLDPDVNLAVFRPLQQPGQVAKTMLRPYSLSTMYTNNFGLIIPSFSVA